MLPRVQCCRASPHQACRGGCKRTSGRRRRRFAAAPFERSLPPLGGCGAQLCSRALVTGACGRRLACAIRAGDPGGHVDATAYSAVEARGCGQGDHPALLCGALPLCGTLTRRWTLSRRTVSHVGIRSHQQNQPRFVCVGVCSACVICHHFSAVTRPPTALCLRLSARGSAWTCVLVELMHHGDAHSYTRAF